MSPDEDDMSDTVGSEAIRVRSLSVGAWLRSHGRVVPLDSIEEAYRGRYTPEELRDALHLLWRLGIAEPWGPTGWFVRSQP